MTNDKVLSVYGFNVIEEKIIKEILSNNKLPELLILKNSMAKMKIGQIVSGLKQDAPNYELPDGKVVLFYNFSETEVNKIFKEIKVAFTEMPICAVVTDTSVTWTLEYLVKHLIGEKIWHEKHSK